LEGLLAGFEASPLAAALRVSRWGYAGVSAAHILGLALLVGAIVPLNLRLLGAWPGILRTDVVRLLVPVALVGLLLAATTGLMLFSVRASEYATLCVFQIKLTLIVIGAASALWAHARYGWRLERAPPRRLRHHAGLSLACWFSALAAGRIIAFVG
jgi:hypothetical protein